MVSAQQTHLEQRRVLSQDRVHANHRGHHAQRFSSFAAFSPAHAPNLSPAIQGPIGGGLPTVGCFHRGVGRATRNERQRAAPLAQGARPRRPPAWRPRPLLPSSRWRCARRRPALQAELRPLAPLAHGDLAGDGKSGSPGSPGSRVLCAGRHRYPADSTWVRRG